MAVVSRIFSALLGAFLIVAYGMTTLYTKGLTSSNLQFRAVSKDWLGRNTFREVVGI